MTALLVRLLLFASLLALRAPAQPTAGDTEGEIDVGGRARRYLLHIPPGYDAADAPVPLVVSLHGLISSARQQAAISGLSDKADTAGFIVVYPQGLGVPTRWDTRPDTADEPNRDVAFIRALVAQLQADLNIDPARVYVTGLSNGGGMTNRLGCDAADVFAAIAPVAGAYTFWEDCEPARPVPVIAFHGTDDPIVPYEGAAAREFIPGLSLPPVPEWAAGWAVRNDCGPASTVTVESFETGDVVIEAWGGCAAGAEVTLYTVGGVGHVWPGGPDLPLVGNGTGPVNASDVIWAFFEAHPMPAPGGQDD